MKLVHSSNPILKTSLNPVNLLNVDKFILFNIKSIMYSCMKRNDGIGLAANQVGLTLRLFVMETSIGEHLMCINPEILWSRDTCQINREGCLSFIGEYIDICRPTEILVRYFDEYKKETFKILKGIDAVCFQHELDHLNGITFHERK